MTDDFVDHPLLPRYLAGDCSPDERGVVSAWLAESPGRAAYVASLQEIQDVVRGEAERPVADSRAAWERMRERVEVPSRPVRVSGSRGLGHTPLQLGMAAVAIVAIIGLSFAALGDRSVGADRWRALSTTAGNQAKITLRDGTQLVLGPASRISIPADFGHGERTVILEGQALFTVVHDSQHPFTVRTAHAVVQDVGTVFGIRCYRDDPDERIAVSEGEVRLGNTRLRAHDLATVDGRGAVHVQRGIDVTSYTAWAQGRLVFSATPLRDVVREIARTYDLTITLADSAVAQNAITASFDHEPADEVLKEITQAIGARYESHGRHVTIRSGQTVTLPANTHHRPVLNVTQAMVSTQPTP